MKDDSIIIRGARVNNLKSVDVDIPHESLTVITGVSGSGKSSLAHDTLYAEGQRRYVESLSAYARQFLGRMPKPEADLIDGLPPAIAIEQKVNTRNPRSTVGTSTEIYDYLRLLFGRVGRTYSPVSGAEVKRHTVEDVLGSVKALPVGTRIALTVPIVLPEGRKLASQLDVWLKAGYSRVMDADGAMTDLAEALETERKAQDEGRDTGNADKWQLLVDRLAASADADELSRLAESSEAAFFEGHGRLFLNAWTQEGMTRTAFSTLFEEDGIKFDEPSDMMFNFNNPVGACEVCGGFGKVMGIDPELVMPNPRLSIHEGAVKAWSGEKMSMWQRRFCSEASRLGVDIHKPVMDLERRESDLLWHGPEGCGPDFPSIDNFFKMVQGQQQKIQYRVMLARFRGKTICPACHGTRLKSSAVNVKVAGKTIGELVAMPVEELVPFFDNITLEANDAKIAERVLQEIRSRLSYLQRVGLGYLTLDRMSATLSGGESQRINLATALGSSLVGSLYILDEPSIGLHPRDTDRLISVLKSLRDTGNTVVVVEHDEEIMNASDYIIDVGPDAGRLGGKIVYQGPSDRLAKADSYTARYLTGRLAIPVPKLRRRHRDYIEVAGAVEHNLKDINVRFPLGAMTVVTGVSGSGKSTLVRDILYRALCRHMGKGSDAAPGRFRELRGDLARLGDVEFVDQNPIGTSSRSNPATYLKAYDEIRRLYADQQASRQMGFTASTFSFNAEGGRCEQCKGEGTVTVEMQFMADLTLPCDACHGKRFKREVLEVRYRGKSIYDVLEMTIAEAIEFFSQEPSAATRRIVKRLQPLADVGLGYVKVGQSSSTLSGGESQRVKLASFLATEKPQPTMYIFDEPTTGLHFHDIATLLRSFDRLIALGHTVVIVEHNMDVIKCADHVIDIGPEGGEAGGNIVVEGTPEAVAECPQSHTGRFLKEKLKH